MGSSWIAIPLLEFERRSPTEGRTLAGTAPCGSLVLSVLGCGCRSHGGHGHVGGGTEFGCRVGGAGAAQVLHVRMTARVLRGNRVRGGRVAEGDAALAGGGGAGGGGDDGHDGVAVVPGGHTKLAVHVILIVAVIATAVVFAAVVVVVNVTVSLVLVAAVVEVGVQVGVVAGALGAGDQAFDEAPDLAEGGILVDDIEEEEFAEEEHWPFEEEVHCQVHDALAALASAATPAAAVVVIAATPA